MNRRIWYLVANIVLILLTGCWSSPMTTDVQRLTSTSTSRSVSLDVTTTSTPLSVTGTPLPTSTSRPTVSPVPTTTVSPTLTAGEEQTLVLELFENNAGCRLPCWWGFTPGETTWSEAEAFFISLGETPAEYHRPEGTMIYNVQLEVPVEIHPQQVTVQHYFVRHSVIEMIWAVGQSPNYTLPQLLHAYGTPAEVWLRTFSSVPEGDELPFFLLLYYPSHGILARYSGFTQEKNGQVPICPQQLRPALWLWSSEREMTLEDVAQANLGGFIEEELLDYRSLEVATGWSVEQFVQTFLQPVGEICLETPAVMW